MVPNRAKHHIFTMFYLGIFFNLRIWFEYTYFKNEFKPQYACRLYAYKKKRVYYDTFDVCLNINQGCTCVDILLDVPNETYAFYVGKLFIY